MVKKIKVKAPATTANLGAGYDVFGLALDGPKDVMKIEKSRKLEIKVRGRSSEKIPEAVEKNSAGIVAKKLGKNVKIKIHKNIPPGSGLGSSAASAAGAAVGIKELFDLRYTKKELVDIAAEGERAAAGEKHYDNVAPAILGNFCIIDVGLESTKNKNENIDDKIISMDVPDFGFIVVLPKISNNTKEARKVVPEKISIEKVKKNIFYASSLVTGILKNDEKLFGKGLNDEIVQPQRSKRLKGFKKAREAALNVGAYGCTLSGSGPAMLAVGPDREKIGEVMKRAFKNEGVGAEIFYSSPGKGVEICSSP